MKSVEHFLAFHLVQAKLAERVVNPQIVEDEEETAWLIFDLKEGKTAKTLKKKLIDLLWGPIQHLYETYVATQLLRDGYICVSIEGGWLVVSPEGNEYQLQEDTCTCDSFVYSKDKQPCKHMLFRDWHNHYRARVNEYKMKRTG